MRQVLTTVLATQFWSFIARTLIRPDFSSWTVSELNGVPISDAHPVITIAVKNEKNNELELVIFSSAGEDVLTFQWSFIEQVFSAMPRNPELGEDGFRWVSIVRRQKLTNCFYVNHQ